MNLSALHPDMDESELSRSYKLQIPIYEMINYFGFSAQLKKAEQIFIVDLHYCHGKSAKTS